MLTILFNQRFTSDGAPALSAATTAGNGTLRFTGAGALGLNGALAAGSGKLIFPATSASTLAPATESGSATLRLIGTGAESLAPATLSGSSTTSSNARMSAGAATLTGSSLSGTASVTVHETAPPLAGRGFARGGTSDPRRKAAKITVSSAGAARMTSPAIEGTGFVRLRHSCQGGAQLASITTRGESSADFSETEKTLSLLLLEL